MRSRQSSWDAEKEGGGGGDGVDGEADGVGGEDVGERLELHV